MNQIIIEDKIDQEKRIIELKRKGYIFPNLDFFDYLGDELYKDKVYQKKFVMNGAKFYEIFYEFVREFRTELHFSVLFLQDKPIEDYLFRIDSYSFNELHSVKKMHEKFFKNKISYYIKEYYNV